MNMLYPNEIRMFSDYGGLPGNICIRYTCPKCGHVVNTEVMITDLWRPLSLPCTNCKAYTFAVTHSFSAFNIVMTGAPPEITMFDAKAESEWLHEVCSSQDEKEYEYDEEEYGYEEEEK